MDHKELIKRLETVVEDWRKYSETNEERATNHRGKSPEKEAKHLAKAQVYRNNADLVEAILGDLDTEEVDLDQAYIEINDRLHPREEGVDVAYEIFKEGVKLGNRGVVKIIP